MSYPGNTSLSTEIRGRILSTFRHSLDMARQGNVQEAALGCDFVLKLDPHFKPASELKTQLDAGALELDGLAETLNQAQAALDAGEPAEELNLDALKDIDLDLPKAQPAAAAAAGGTETAGGSLLDEGPSLDLVGGDAESFDLTDAGDAAAPPPAAGIDLGAAPSGSGDGQDRIEELLAEGQAAFDRGEHQTAIDAWSRIFLIDIDNVEAGRRIELARKLKAEVERKVEEAFHEGVTLFDAGRPEEAKQAFERALQLQPNHLAAQEYLDQIAAGGGRTPVADGPDVAPPPPIDTPTSAAPAAPAAPAADDTGDLLGPTDDLLGSVDLDEELGGELPPMPEAEAVPEAEAAPEPAAEPTAAPKAVVAKKKSSSRSFVMIGSAVLALVLVGGWFLLSKWDSLFQNATPAPTEPAAPEQSAIERAKALAAEGKSSLAIARLRRIPADSPDYAEAQSLIAQWSAPAQPGEAEAGGGLESDSAERQGELVAAARAAADRSEHLRAEHLLTEAAGHGPLDEETAALLEQVRSELVPLQRQIGMVRQGDWEFALPDLWRMHAAEPDNKNIVQLIVDCYYNLGVRDLQRGDVTAAGEKISEALELHGDDPALARLSQFATTYSSRSPDLMYRIYVKYLPLR